VAPAIAPLPSCTCGGNTSTTAPKHDNLDNIRLRLDRWHAFSGSSSALRAGIAVRLIKGIGKTPFKKRGFPEPFPQTFSH
jgi:hypothetical protein